MTAMMQVDQHSANESSSNDEESAVLVNNGEHAFEVSNVDALLAVRMASISMR